MGFRAVDDARAAERARSSAAQGELALGAPPRRAPARRSKVFFATLPERDAALRMAELARRLRREHGLTGQPTPPERLHVSLVTLGAYAEPPPALLDVARRAGEALKAQPFAVSVDRALSFKGASRLPLVLTGRGLAALIDLRAALGAALQRFAVVRSVKPGFTPHVTLLYDERSVGETVVEPVSWTVREIVLVQSLHGEGRHLHLARWPLAG